MGDCVCRASLQRRLDAGRSRRRITRHVARAGASTMRPVRVLPRLERGRPRHCCRSSAHLQVYDDLLLAVHLLLQLEATLPELRELMPGGLCPAHAMRHLESA